MIILGIDTSCDDTSASVVVDGRQVLSNVIHTQAELHRPHGGVVPELASREHLKNIRPVVKEALKRANCKITDLDGIAVTIGPGLVGALLVGLYYAKGLAYVHKIPMIAINHLEGHILSIFLEEEFIAFPFVALTVSGGHTSLYRVDNYGGYTLLGQTLDDAAGEAFDKVAKIMGLGYPGGRPIEDIAKTGSPDKIKFPRAYLSKDSLDFSFSGLKTSVAIYLKKWQDGQTDPEVTLADIAASFQEAVLDVLAHKLMLARDKVGASHIVLAGGVACNNRLKTRLAEEAAKRDIRLSFPPPEYCTDNGAMVAVAGYYRLLNGERADMTVDVRSRYPVQDLIPMV